MYLSWHFNQAFPFWGTVVGEMEAVIVVNIKSGIAFNMPKCWCPEEYEKLTNDCCSLDPTDRPNFRGKL